MQAAPVVECIGHPIPIPRCWRHEERHGVVPTPGRVVDNRLDLGSNIGTFHIDRRVLGAPLGGSPGHCVGPCAGSEVFGCGEGGRVAGVLRRHIKGDRPIIRTCWDEMNAGGCDGGALRNGYRLEAQSSGASIVFAAAIGHDQSGRVGGVTNGVSEVVAQRRAEAQGNVTYRIACRRYPFQVLQQGGHVDIVFKAAFYAGFADIRRENTGIEGCAVVEGTRRLGVHSRDIEGLACCIGGGGYVQLGVGNGDARRDIEVAEQEQAVVAERASASPCIELHCGTVTDAAARVGLYRTGVAIPDVIGAVVVGVARGRAGCQRAGDAGRMRRGVSDVAHHQ
ncbi:hypothetical protein FQZ97_821650 [compost metagenome]